MRILALDLGDRRIGAAVSDPLGITAQGLETFEHRGWKAVLETLRRLVVEHEVCEIVVGLPIDMNGALGQRARRVLDQIPSIESAAGVPVKTWDERLTSLQAERLMIEGGLSRQKRKENSDRIAAVLILQAYLDSKRGAPPRT